MSPPSRIVIPAIGVDTDIVSVGLEEARAVEVPEDIHPVGWFRHTASPGAASGSAVLVAHRDGREQGHGVFYDLGRLELGDRVTVATDGDARLTLISCSGIYDRDAGGSQRTLS